MVYSSDDDVETRFATSYRFSPHFSPDPDEVDGGYSVNCMSVNVQQSQHVSACSSSASFNMPIGTATSSAFELTTIDHSVSSQLSNGDYQSDCESSHDASSLANTAATSSTAVVGSAYS